VTPRTQVAVAFAGSVAMAVSSWWCAGLQAGRETATASYVFFYLGLGAVLTVWVLLGREIFAGRRSESNPRQFMHFSLAVALPLLGAAPFGRDLWAYAAQGNLVRHGLDPYTHGPLAVPGIFTDQVSPRWLDSASPYGPVWLRLSHLAVDLSAGHPTIAALLLRLPALAGLMLSLWAVPRLAALFDGTLATGLWLGLASPLTLVLGIGGGHNDLLMLGLILAGCALAAAPTDRALALGAAVLGVGVLVKSPAAIGVAFTVPLHLHVRGKQQGATPHNVLSVLRACAIAILSAGAVIALISLVSGLGYGWTSQVNSDAQWISWLSLPSAVVLFGRLVAGASPLKHLDATLRHIRTVGEVLAIVVAALLWFYAVIRNERARLQLACLAGALGAAAVLAPSVQPWYYCWGLSLAGLVVLRPLWIWLLAAVAVVFPVMIMPSGSGMESDWRAFPVIAAALVVAAFATDCLTRIGAGSVRSRDARL
jgi:alpha-1,6-mannosyltransferase